MVCRLYPNHEPLTLVRWLDKDKGLSVTLTPDRDGDGVGDALEGGVEADYTVTIYTSDIRWGRRGRRTRGGLP